MTERHFPDDQEVDQWISTHFLDDTATSSPVIDQLKAASNDATNRFRTAAPGLVANGLAEWAFTGDTTAPADRTQLRGVARQVMAAESVGILPLCRHTSMIRPQVLICDPPILVCTACLPSRLTLIETLEHFWTHQCDRCGVHVDKLAPITIAGFGHFTVTGHVCSRCASDDQRLAAKAAEQVLVVGNRRARRRGGAR